MLSVSFREADFLTWDSWPQRASSSCSVFLSSRSAPALRSSKFSSSSSRCFFSSSFRKMASTVLPYFAWRP